MLKSLYGLGILLLVILLCVGLNSCKNETTNKSTLEGEPEATENADTLLSEDLPSDFIPFYMKFFADTSYQKAHIVFPLKMKADSSLWQKNNWTCHVAFDDPNGNFQQKFYHLNGLVFEHIADPKNLLRVERRYSKTSDGYNLIYYTKTNAFENTEGWSKGESE